MKILALDPATKCGWAHSSGPSGTWDLSIRRDESAGMRLIRLKGKLDEIRRDAGIDVLVYEAARHAAPKMQGALVVQSELQGVIKLWCSENHIEFRGYSPSELKKHATGKGNANKEAMMKAGREKWPACNGDDNEYDARWLLDLFTKTL
jgi:Holliday junction resolvasome RuvABC endonuclease subunit